MPILKGFPPSNLISPGIRISEKDPNFQVPAPGNHRAGLVGFASKGPINIPTLVTSTRELHTIFGNPHPDVGDPYLLYAAEQYLQVGNQLYVVRVAETSPTNSEAADTASVVVPTAGGVVAIESNTAPPYSFDVDSFFRWRLNGILASKVLVVLADDNRPSPDTGNSYSVDELIEALNDQLDSTIDGIEFYESDDGNIAVHSTFSYGSSSSVELVSVKDAVYGGVWNDSTLVFDASISGLGTLMESASIEGVYDRYPSDGSTGGQYDTSGLSTSLQLQIVVDGTDNVNIDNVVQVVNLTKGVFTVDAYAAEINSRVLAADVPGGFAARSSGDKLEIVTRHSGRDAKVMIKPVSTASPVFGFDGNTHSGVSPSGSSDDADTYADGIVTGSANSDDTACFTVNADTPGIDGNNTQVIITNNVTNGTFTLDVFSYGEQVETWGGLSKVETNTFYVETYIANVSDYLRVTDNTDTLALPAPGTYSLSGGSDGIPADPDDQDTLLVGNDAALTGLQALSDPDQTNIDVVAIPGHTSTAVILDLLDFCENKRQDCFAVVDSPFGLTVTEVVQWQNGVHPLNNVQFDSHFGALYWPWIKIRDAFNRVDVWVPPSGNVMAAYAKNDQQGGAWFAPAGTTRGLLYNVLDAFSRPSLTERDSMYGSGNAVNPIMQFADQPGFMIFGQKTLSRTVTAFSRINVKRMLLFVEKEIKTATRGLLFEPHDEQLRRQFINIAKTILERLQLSRGITGFTIQCDTTLNTDDVVDRGEMKARIGVIPTHAVEYVFIELALFPTGSDFSESEQI